MASASSSSSVTQGKRRRSDATATTSSPPGSPRSPPAPADAPVEAPTHPFTGVDLDQFTETYDVAIDNFSQVLPETPSFPWTFRNPSRPNDDPLEFSLAVCPDTNHRPPFPPERVFSNQSRYSVAHRPSLAAALPPSARLGSAVAVPFLVKLTNLCKRDIKLKLTVTNVDWDGTLLEKQQCRQHNTYHHNASCQLSFANRNARPTVRLQVKVEIINGLVYDNRNKRAKIENAQVSTYRTMASDVKALLGDPNFEDIILKCQDTEIPCSKFLVCSRSSVFRAMFTHRMKEAKEGVVLIENAEAATVKDMLEFMYSDNVEDVTVERLIKLLPLAEFYGITSLSGFCSEVLLSHVSMEHVAQIAIVAEQHQVTRLQERVNAFLLQNAHQVDKAKGWPDVQRLCPEVANRVIKNLAQKAGAETAPRAGPDPRALGHANPNPAGNPNPNPAPYPYFAGLMVPPVPPPHAQNPQRDPAEEQIPQFYGPQEPWAAGPP